MFPIFYDFEFIEIINLSFMQNPPYTHILIDDYFFDYFLIT